MEKSIVIYDAEYWTDEGCMARRWTGLNDHRPYLIQFSAIKVSLTDGLPELDRCDIFMKPIDRYGNEVKITAFFTELTNITNEVLDEKAVPIPNALAEIKKFVANDICYSTGGDETEMAISTYLWQEEHPLNPKNCRDVRHVLNKCGMTEKEIRANTSGTFATYLGLNFDGHVHDAGDDSLSILTTFRHFMEQGKLTIEDLSR